MAESAPGGTALARFGLFGGKVQTPMQAYEGDKMEQNGAYVCIYKEESVGGNRRRRQVAAIRLDHGQSVKVTAGRGIRGGRWWGWGGSNSRPRV